MDLPAGLTFSLTGGNSCFLFFFIQNFSSSCFSLQLKIYISNSFYSIFNSTVQRWLTTAPGAPTTHWYQIRCVLSQPIYVMAGQEITGRLHLIAHSAQSYTIDLTLSGAVCFFFFSVFSSFESTMNQLSTSFPDLITKWVFNS